jgi:hypothetical protein
MPVLSLVDPVAVASKLATSIPGSSTPQTGLPPFCSALPTNCVGVQIVGGVMRVPATLPDGGTPPGGITVLPVTASFTTSRRGIPYTTKLAACVVDDPSDGIGVATGAPCDPLPPSSGGGGLISTSGSTSLNLNVLGIQITGGGALVEVVCSLFGTRGSIVDQLLGSGGLLGGLVNTGADTTFCSGGKGTVAMDRQPIDATAVTASVTWPQTRAGRGGTVTQRVVISGPRVTS